MPAARGTLCHIGNAVAQRQPECLSCTQHPPPTFVGTVFFGFDAKPPVSSLESGISTPVLSGKSPFVIHFSYIIGRIGLCAAWRRGNDSISERPT